MMLSVEEAQSLILTETSTNPEESVPLDCLAHRVAASTVLSQWPLPGWDNSAMDGYALRADDLKDSANRLCVSDHIAAGDGVHRRLKPKTAARIFTGALMPTGADTVVVQEDTVREGDWIDVQCVPKVGQHIRRAGSDIALGQTILQPGQFIRPGDISLLASQGYVETLVYGRPQVTVLTTGDELREPGSGPPQRGEIIDGNTVALMNAVRGAGGQSIAGRPLPDDASATEKGLRECAPGFVISTGGASVGDHDHVAHALRRICGEGFRFWKIAVKPGKPVVFGRTKTHTYFGLPGNPVSALVSFELFVRPALLASQGHRQPVPSTMTATLDNSISKGGRRREYRRGVLRNIDGSFHVRVFDAQSSGALSSIAGANALVVIPKNEPPMQVGESVQVLRLGGQECFGGPF